MDGNALRRRPSFLEQTLGPVQPLHEPETVEAGIKEARNAVPAPMLDVVLRDGRVRSFSYAYLSEVEFLPGDTLYIRFTFGVTIIAEGRGLARHRQQVRQHRADEIRECTESEVQNAPEDVALVERITILEGENQ